jgi:PAS domain S-box-containing protein
VLQASTARHRALFETTPDGVIILNDAGYYVEVNNSLCRLLRASRAQLVGAHFSQFLSPDHLSAAHTALETLKTTGVYAGEFPIRAVDGTLVELEWRARAHFLPGLHFCIARDITTRKQAQEALLRLTQTLQQREEALRQVNATLEQRVEERTIALRREIAERQRLEQEARRAEHFALLGRLAAGVSHEIRNPLGAIMLHVDLLEEELRQPAPDSVTQIPESLAEIKTHLARLDDLVQDYLSLVRVATIERTPQHLGAVVQAWAQEWLALAAAQGVTLRLNGMAELGMVALHENTMRRALLNLVQNALEAMPQGGILTLLGHVTATQAQLLVRDTGSGIPAEQLGRIFEPLYTTKPGGTGLGLYIVQEIVAAHEGQVTVESTKEQGTTFTITLPRALAGTGTQPLEACRDG